MVNEFNESAKEVADLIEGRILTRRYSAGSWLPTERDLANEFVVSRPVIRRAIALLVERGQVDKAAGRRPSVRQSPPDSSAVSSPLKTIAAIFPHSAHPANLDLIRGIHRGLRLFESSHRLIVLDTDGEDGSMNAERERDALLTVAREGIAGALIWQIGGDTSEEALAFVLEAGIPVVCIDRYPLHVTCDFVGVDNRAGARYAVEYLMRLGHRRIVHFTLPAADHEATTSAVVERRHGFEDALSLRQLKGPAKLVYDELDELVAVLASSSSDRPTAVFAVNDGIADLLEQATSARGLSVPDDYSIIGFDGLSSLWHPAAWLTTMNISFNDIGDRATELLLRRIAQPAAGSEPRQHILLPTSLVQRTSCRQIHEEVSSDPTVASK